MYCFSFYERFIKKGPIHIGPFFGFKLIFFITLYVQSNPPNILIMRLYKLITISILISFSSINSLEAQLLKKLKKRVQEATEEVVIEKAAQKSAQETGKAMDSLLEIDPDYQSNYQNQLNQMMAAGSQSIPIEAFYTFDNRILYEMEITSENKPTIINYEMWFSNNADDFR